ncbi:hypothetical protein KDM41_07150, partial [bacterium]|nr:hypothetical protein [bacterium]
MSDITNFRARVSGPRLRGAGLGLVLLAAVAVGTGPAAAQQSGEAVRTFIERNDELLMWARDLVAETESDQARRVLRQAADLHQRSVDILDGGRPVEALAVGRRARDAIWHAVRLAREAMGLEERIRIRAERFRDLHQDLSERARAGNNEQALQFLERARQQADRARELVRQGDFQLAWNLLDQAGDLMARAARVLAADAGPERLDAELERARAAIARAREQLGDGARPHQLDLLAEAEDAWQRADAARAAGQPGQALQLA